VNFYKIVNHFFGGFWLILLWHHLVNRGEFLWIFFGVLGDFGDLCFLVESGLFRFGII